MYEYKVRIGENGRVLIPAALRSQLHFEPGDELIMRIEDEELRLISMKNAIKKAQALVSKYVPRHRSLVAALKTARKAEAKNE